MIKQIQNWYIEDKRFVGPETKKIEGKLSGTVNTKFDTTHNTELKAIYNNDVSFLTYNGKSLKRGPIITETEIHAKYDSYFDFTSSDLEFTKIRVYLLRGEISGCRRFEDKLFNLRTGGILPTLIVDGTLLGTPEDEEPPTPATKFVKFTYNQPFNVGLVSNKWLGVDNEGNPGTIQYSTNKTTWNNWDGQPITAVLQDSGNFEVYLRGNNNYHTSTGNGDPGIDETCFNVTDPDDPETKAPFNVIGEINHLLDWENEVFECGRLEGLFANTSIVDASGLILCEMMDLEEEDNHGNFWGMFYKCESLKYIPSLPAKQIPKNCYQGMFKECTNITFAADGVVTDHPVRIPTEGNIVGTVGEGALEFMFFGCSGNVPSGSTVGRPTVETTYYLV